MRIALVHDYLCTVGGSERVFEYMCEAFPDADVFTLSLNPSRTVPYFATKRDVHTPWLNLFVQRPASFRLLFPIATYAMEGFDLRGYDLVLRSSETTQRLD